MKKILLTSAAVIFQVTLLFAQGIDVENFILEHRDKTRMHRQEEVSDATIKSFHSLFPGATDEGFFVGPKYDEVSFRLNQEWHRAFFDNDGSLVGETTEEPANKLPAGSIPRIEEKYPGYIIKDVVKLQEDTEDFPEGWIYGENIPADNVYFAELQHGDRQIIVEVSENGQVSFYHKYPA